MIHMKEIINHLQKYTYENQHKMQLIKFHEMFK